MHLDSAIAVSTAALLIACAPLPLAQTSLPKLKDEVAAFLNAYLAAVGSRDTTKIGNSYVSDERFVWIENGKVRYRKVDEVLASLATFPAGSAIRTELED